MRGASNSPQTIDALLRAIEYEQAMVTLSHHVRHTSLTRAEDGR